MRSTHLYRSAAALVLAAVALSACGPDGATPAASTDQSALPLATGEALSIAPAPTVEALPAAPATKVVYVSEPEQSYEYVDDAYAMSDAIGDAPPDYGFDYEDSHPWAWRTAGDALRLYEATSDGDRYYYYRRGESDPYLVRDSGYAYAYSGGNLVTVYDDRGRALDRNETDRRSEYAGRYLARARSLERAAAQDRRQQVVAANWAARQSQVRQDNARWADQQRQSAQWQAYHNRQTAQKNTQWQAERTRRQQESVAFNRWHDNNYQGQPPRTVAVNQPAKPPAQNWQFWKRQDQQNRAQQQKAAQQKQQQAKQQQAHDQQIREQQTRDQQTRQIQQRQQQARQDQQQKTAAQQAQQKQQAARQAQAKTQREHQAQTNKQTHQKQQAVKHAQTQKQQAAQLAQQKQQAARQAQAKAQQTKRQAQTHKQTAEQAQAKKQNAGQLAQQKQQVAKLAQAKKQQQAEAKAKAEHRPINKGRPDERNGA